MAIEIIDLHLGRRGAAANGGGYSGYLMTWAYLAALSCCMGLGRPL